MDLSGLLSLIETDRDLQALAAALGPPAAQVAAALPRPARAACLAALQRRLGRPLLVVTSTPELRPFHEELQAWCGPGAEVLLLPEPEGLPYERLPAHPAVAGERLATLARLSQGVGPSGVSGEPALTLTLSQREREHLSSPSQGGATGTLPDADAPTFVVTTPRALCQITASPERFAASRREIQPGQRLNLHQLLQTLVALGYEPAPLVEMPGSFARRGGLVDIFPPGDAAPCRIELFGDEVDTLRLFDPGTQRTTGLATACHIMPARELLLGPQPGPQPLPEGEGTGSDLPTAVQGNARGDGLSAGLDLDGLKGDARAQWERELADLAQGAYFTGADYYLSLFSASCALDYLGHDWLVALDGPAGLDRSAAEVEAQAEELRQQMIQRGELPPAFPPQCLPWEAARRRLALGRLLEIQPWQEGAGCLQVASLGPAPAFAGRLRQLISETGDLARGGGRVVLLSQQAPRLVEVFAEAGQPLERREGLEALPAAGEVVVLSASVGEGWVLGGASSASSTTTPRLVLLTDHELFGFSKERRVTRRAAVHRDPFLFDFHEGDYVVHVDHGIARFAGVVRLAFGGPEREYLLLLYAEGAKLYVPAEQADRVSRYVGPREGPPALSRLGTGEWARAKRRVRRSVDDLARDLLALYAERQVAQGRAFSPDTVWQDEMESAFPYVETPDQLQVVGDVKGDMEQPRPMDRLVCGDVGYGKTEVAIRAAFKAVMDGCQVAVLVPTTVLAMQHRRTFGERLAAFPVRIEMLSRFRTEREQAEVVAALREGQVDICIGTHRLLQADVSFQNLGLVIVDEEQRFGVAHKERLKRLRREVDVLTLSATPIPRTLHMALAGVRDMSLLQTPPEDRLPIRTFVAEYDASLIRETMLRELDRGGQIFFVHNRVQGIQAVARQLADLVPEARVAVGHGQMPEEELERVMVEFTEGRQDVLVCTTIIESGLDMPNVNTIIINRADRFGLTQLYQLRGRVGRGANRAYAYLLYRRDRELTPTAERRLQAIYEARELGAGFQIALKDLEIRGAGNLLGVEQSGQIGAVGFDLYCRLLGEAVAAIKADGSRPPAVASEVSVELPLARYLPEEYVPDLKQRLEVYRRLGSLAGPADADGLEEELRDRFGPLPDEAANLLFQARMQLLARQANVERISQENGHLVLWLGEAAARRAVLLQHQRIAGLHVGHRQARLDLRSSASWPQTLEAALATLAAAVQQAVGSRQ